MVFQDTVIIRIRGGKPRLQATRPCCPTACVTAPTVTPVTVRRIQGWTPCWVMLVTDVTDLPENIRLPRAHRALYRFYRAVWTLFISPVIAASVTVAVVVSV